MILKINNFNFYFSEYEVKYSFISCTQYNGVRFIVDKDIYEILANKDLGDRLLINKPYFWHDIPFKKDTFKFLPKQIRCEEI